MRTNQKGIELIHRFESCKLEAYECPASLNLPPNKKFWTIGWGNTTYADGSKVKKGDKITQAQADRLFEIVLSKFEREVSRLVKVNLTDNQFSALVSFAYNVGTANLASSTLLKKVNANPNDPTIAYEFSRWNKASGTVLNGLVNRRKAESDLYFSK